MPRPCFISKKDIRGTICCWRCYEVVHFYIFFVAFLLLLDRLLHNAQCNALLTEEPTRNENNIFSKRKWFCKSVVNAPHFLAWIFPLTNRTHSGDDPQFLGIALYSHMCWSHFRMAFLYKIITFLNESENRVGILPTASINLFRSETERPFSPLHTQMYFEMLRQKMHTRMHFDRILAVV